MINLPLVVVVEASSPSSISHSECVLRHQGHQLLDLPLSFILTVFLSILLIFISINLIVAGIPRLSFILPFLLFSFRSVTRFVVLGPRPSRSFHLFSPVTHSLIPIFTPDIIHFQLYSISL